ncbi:MAG: 2-oxo acid dehydrogenase subunit E2 [Ignavibacteria bacterium]
MEFDNVRQKMAEHMIVSKRVSPHVQAIAECDMTNIDKVRLSMGDEFLQKKDSNSLTCHLSVKQL